MRIGLVDFLPLAVLVGVAWVGWSLLLAWSRTLRLTRAFHGMSPAKVWLLLIPIFNLIWNFHLVNVATRGVKARFQQLGRDPGDAGHGIGTTYSIVVAVTFVVGAAARSHGGLDLVHAALVVVSLIVAVLFWRRLVALNRVMEAPLPSSPA